ncbi:MAG: four helix bundle protein [Saprospiraceae bacterium]|nr:four helix bundle protein [Saprospiraceae bacterium]
MGDKPKHKMTPQELEDRLIAFASRIIDLVESLPKGSAAAKHLGGQLLRSGTSLALNYGEVRAAESTDDFVHKMKVCLKELRETLVCLKLIRLRKWFPENRLEPLLGENNELISIFVTSLNTSSGKQPQPKKS